nr:hypothetical protein Iba_chr14dCG2140 [Ipomoea batatas]GME07549.1 hypothetical protein Iba_scaffold6333CG0130 [Ipomoea batatas]
MDTTTEECWLILFFQLFNVNTTTFSVGVSNWSCGLRKGDTTKL